MQRIENYIDGNREDLKTTWKRELKDGSLYLYFGSFKFIIPKVETDKIKNLKNEEQILNLRGVIQVANETIKYIFNNNGRCNFKELLESLDVLEKEYRRDDDEHLCVVEANNKINDVCYININNGVIYILNNPAGLGRLWYSNIKDKNGFSCIVPYYRNGKYFDYKCNEITNEKSKIKYIKIYDKISIDQKTMQMLKFKIKTK